MIPFKKEWTPLRRMMLMQAAGGAAAMEDVEVSGNPVVFSTDLARPLKRLALALLPRQSGTGDPSPSNIRPLIPWGEVGTWHGGKNLLNATGTSEYFTVSDGVYTVANVPSTAKSFVLGTMKLKQGETYILSGGLSAYLYMTFSYNGTNYSTKGGDSQPFTATGDDTISIAGVITTSAQVGQKLFPMVRIASTDSAFVPYSPITPFPVNLRKNLFDASSVVRRDGYTINDQGQESASVLSGYTKNITPVKPSTEYTFSGNISSAGYLWRIYFFDISGSFISRTDAIEGTYTLDVYTFTTPSNCYGVCFQYTQASVDFSSFMLEEGSTATAFQPYLPPVYGCELDLTTGEVWANYAMMPLNGTEAVQTLNVYSGGNGFRIAPEYNGYPKMISGSNLDGVCNVMPTVSVSTTFGARFGIRSSSIYLVQCNDIFGTTVDELKAYLAQHNMELCYPIEPVLLATLTPQQINAIKGTNTIWSDADSADVIFTRKKVHA